MQADAGPERLANVSGGAGAPERDDVALLIDFENLKWSLQNRYHVAPSLGSLMEAVSEQGRIVVARAYADWTDGRLRLDARTCMGPGSSRSMCRVACATALMCGWRLTPSISVGDLQTFRRLYW
jgi:hypothetical protein